MLDIADEHPSGAPLVRMTSSRWPVAAAVAVAAILQVLLPNRFAPGHRLLPMLELLLLVVLVIADPRGHSIKAVRVRRLTVLLTAMVTVTNAWSAVRLVTQIIAGKQDDALILLTSGALIWATNVIVFGLWYWQLDRGGPLAVAQCAPGHRDFVFPQQQDDRLSGWEPRFPDYLYLAYTNATAFSPTDVMPYTVRAKMIMMFQSGISLIVIALVIARAIGLFK